MAGRDPADEPPTLRILHLVSGRTFTGPAAAALADALALHAAGHQAWLGGRGEHIEDGCRAAGLPFAGTLKLGRGPKRLLNFPADIRRLRELQKEFAFDVVHVHRSDEQLLAYVALGRKKLARIVRTWHRDPRKAPAALARRCAAACCVTREHEAVLKKLGVARARFIPPGVDTDAFQPAFDAEPPREPVLGLVGRWKSAEDRGQLAFLEVARALPGDLAWRGQLVGRGEGRVELEAAIASHPAKARLELLEPKGNYAARLAALDVGLVFAVGSDGTSRAAAELLACGVPLLVADVPGLREFGEDAACARVLPGADPAAFARAAAEWLRDAAGRSERRTAARQRAEGEHALAVRGARLAELYSS